jgi:antitoxin PrlF
VSTSTLTSKGQVTIPKDVRDRLGLKEGDRLVFKFDERGNLLVRPESKDPLGRLPGLLSHLARERPVTIEEMEEAVKEHAVKRFKRAVQR